MRRFRKTQKATQTAGFNGLILMKKASTERQHCQSYAQRTWMRKRSLMPMWSASRTQSTKNHKKNENRTRKILVWFCTAQESYTWLALGIPNGRLHRKTTVSSSCWTGKRTKSKMPHVECGQNTTQKILRPIIVTSHIKPEKKQAKLYRNLNLPTRHQPCCDLVEKGFREVERGHHIDLSRSRDETLSSGTEMRAEQA